LELNCEYDEQVKTTLKDKRSSTTSTVLASLNEVIRNENLPVFEGYADSE
jgi:hypothetical protein